MQHTVGALILQLLIQGRVLLSLWVLAGATRSLSEAPQPDSEGGVEKGGMSLKLLNKHSLWPRALGTAGPTRQQNMRAPVSFICSQQIAERMGEMQAAAYLGVKMLLVDSLYLQVALEVAFSAL